jgi:hypothetical protein
VAALTPLVAALHPAPSSLPSDLRPSSSPLRLRGGGAGSNLVEELGNNLAEEERKESDRTDLNALH